MTRITPPTLKCFRYLSLIAICTIAAIPLNAQSPQPRIQAKVSSAQMFPLKGSLHPLAQERFDSGAMPTGKRITGVTIAFNRSAAQQIELEALLAAQQNPASPEFHKWLTPDQFAARFGMAQSDIDKVQAWLQQQGFTIDSVSRSRNSIRFSGTVGQVNQAFGTQMHFYNVGGEQHFAPSTALSLPTAIASVVQGVRNLNDFRPRSMRVPRPKSAFTSNQSGNVFFAPGDIKVAYDVIPLVTGGIDGTGQTIAIVGQSAISVTDIENFQSAAGLTPKNPTMVLVPGTGSSATSSGDQGESDLDLEWSSAMAPGATVFFVYTGNNQNYSAFDSIIYAVDQKIGTIISASYGTCESSLGGYSLESTFQQAAAQGQTVLAASGDSGSSACYGLSGLTATQQEVLDVNYPASSPNVTAVGGTEVSQTNSAYYSSNSAYWSAAPSADVLTSALQYLPEVAWNDEVYIIANGGTGLSATGGGVSSLFSKPSWQTGVTGIPADGYRDVPDVSLYSSPIYVGYLYCTSDQTNWGTTSAGVPQANSCNSGFRDQTTGLLTVAGGTSFATPIFAGMVALVNQKQGYVNGQGLINPQLYTLAANSATYASAFHDTTSGNNECLAGTSFCSSTAGTTTKYTAGTGYDQVTGLGSVDLSNLATAWPVNSGSSAGLIDTTTTVSASNAAPNAGDNVVFTVTVASVTGTSTPTGDVTLQIDGGTTNGGTTVANQVLTSGTLTYTTSFTTSGVHQVIAQYAGDSTYAASVGVVQVSVGGSSSGTGSIALAAANLTVAQGSSGSSTVTVTPSGGYLGTVSFQVATSSSSLTNACYSITNATVTGTAAVTTALTVYTSSTSCGGAGLQSGPGANKSYPPGTRFKIAGPSPRTLSSNPVAPVSRAAFGFLALLLAGLVGWRFRKLRALAAVLVLAAAGFALSGCGGGSSSSSGSSSSNAPTGTYTLTVTGADTTNASITASTNLTLTIN